MNATSPLAKALSWVASNQGTKTEAYIAGHQSRDAEVALLKAKIDLLEKDREELRTYIHAHI
jgi:hypothetical protein